ncbi:hypothetical protein BaRGS_00036288 [Batillaria attramentaria]|uniref:Ig-like domain-containing protein n=1 Tax=Batillaria attramentaria TaxID=370345 RepID=A0ABD0JCD6_9CAEN
MLFLVGLILLSWLNEFEAVRLPQTEDNGLITIVDDVQPSIIVCDEFDSMSSVTWSVVQPDNTVIVIGSCGSSQTICQSSDPNIALSRSVQNPESYMRIKSGHLGYTGTSVRCAQGTASAATAKLHIIRRGTISDCEYTRDTTAWRVVLKCAITDTFSSEKTYTCNWYLSPSSETQSLMTDLIRDSAEPDQQYISGQCSITRGLPTTAGVYIYSLQFYPGPVTPVTVANLTLRSPEPRLVATCPEYVAENYTLICDCITTDPGSPPSSIRWSGFNSHQLTVHNVTRHMNGTEFKCVQTWGRRMIQTLWYILRVADPPSQPVIRGYATNQVLTVGDNVSLTCTVSGGKPPITDITFYCQRNGLESSAGIFDPLSSSSTVAIDLLDASDNGTVCLCIGVWRPDTTRYFRGAVSLKVAGREPMAPKVEFLAINANSNYESLTVNEGAPRIEANSQFQNGSSRIVQLQNATSESLGIVVIAYPAPSVGDIAFLAPPDQKSSNIWAYVGGGVAAGVIVVAVVVGVFIYRKCFGRDLYDRPQLRHPEPDNYTDLVLYEDIGVAQRQGGRSRSTVYENTALASPYANDRGDTGQYC